MKDGTHTLAGRLQLALAERRSDLGLSLRELARFSGVAASTIRKIEHGGRVHPERMLAVSRALTELELHAPPAFDPLAALASPRMLGDVDRHGDVTPSANAA